MEDFSKREHFYNNAEYEGQPKYKKRKLEESDIGAPAENEEKMKQALNKFRRSSEQQILHLTSADGLDLPAAITAVVEKLRSDHNENSPAKEEDVLRVMEMGGFSKIDAMRALLMRDELEKLRLRGLHGTEAIEELGRRLNSLIGSKRKTSDTIDHVSDLHIKAGSHSKKHRSEFSNTSMLSSSSPSSPSVPSPTRQMVSSTQPNSTSNSIHPSSPQSLMLSQKKRFLQSFESETPQKKAKHDHH
eukprot:TRINITY_DN13162_c0_g1_i1.p1 TRINITY_DN13162_c0_g1~~TRINITY_DN13162_c0_g1_i1.p1  ORF type:complete len:245 (-),score=50.15 TRINITY_DN13162_c0_g1_i1:96-830(-)